jgi:hypothetical protein
VNRAALFAALAAIAACGEPPARARSAPPSVAAVPTATPAASASSPPTPSASTATQAAGVPGSPGAIARFGSLTYRVPNVVTRVYAFDDGRVWSFEGLHVRDVKTDEIVMTVSCAAADILPSGDLITCLRREPSRVDLLRIPGGEVDSTVTLGIPPLPSPRGKHSIFADAPAGIEVTESGGLRVTVSGKLVTLSPPPFVIKKIEKAPDPIAVLFSSSPSSAPQHQDPPRNRSVSPDGSVRATVDKKTKSVSVVAKGKREGVTGWAPSDMPIHAALVSDGGFVIGYGTSWERLDHNGKLVGGGDRQSATHYMMGPFVHDGKDGAFVGAQSNHDEYAYRLLTPELSAAPLFRTDRCLAQVPGTTSIVCSDIRVPPGEKHGAEGDIVLFDALTGKERARRNLGKDHLTNAYVASDGGILVELSLGKRQILNRDLSVAVPSLEETIKKSGKMGYVVGLLPGRVAIFRATREPGLWAIEGETFRPLFVEPGAETSGVEVSPDGRRVAVVVHRGRATELLLLDAATGNRQARFVGEMGHYVGGLAFDAKGERVLTAAQGVVWLWDATSRGVP